MSKPSDYRVGDRIELHPATDLWMRGARYGIVAAIGRKYVHIRLSMHEVKQYRVLPDNILSVLRTVE